MKKKKLDVLKARDINPRVMDDADRVRLGKTLREFGDLGGVVLNIRSGQLVGGHQRVQDFRSDKRAVVVAERKLEKPDATGSVAFGYVVAHGTRYSYREVDWPAKKEAAANLAANRVHGEFDMPQVGEMLRGLGDGFDFELTGFDPGEVVDILAEESSNEDRPDNELDRSDELAKHWGVKLGQIWILGAHRLMCGDSMDESAVKSFLAKDRPKAIVTDPPYGIGKLMQGGTWAVKQDSQFKKMRRWDNETSQKFFDHVLSFNVPSVVWGGNYFQVPPSRCWLVWNKPEFPTMSSAEMAWTNLDQNTKRIDHPRTHQTDGKKEHATQKPLKVIEWSLSFLPDGLVYEPFSGSGTTLMACEQTARRCRAIEIDPGYVAVAIQRWADATGGQPKLA